jgi:hypothetical protein
MRRLALLAASAVAVLPSFALAADGPPAAGASGDFIPPPGPLVLTRTLQRELPDRKQVVATRRYTVRIVPDGEGFRVDGTLLDVTVEAPPQLAALAGIERKRSDLGLFPFRLDARGMIISPAAPGDRAAAQAAGNSARRSIAASPLGEADRRQASGFVSQVVASGAMEAGGKWPDDLFRPAVGQRSQTSRFDLPGGGTASVTTTIVARHMAGKRATDTIERTVVTETGGARRVTHEIYTVAPGPG